MAKIEILYKVSHNSERYKRINTDDSTDEYEIHIVDTGYDGKYASVHIGSKMVRDISVFDECTKVIVDGVKIFP